MTTSAPARMRAIVQDRYGPVEAVRLAHVARPDVGVDEVIVRVEAAGVDRATWHIATGLPYPMRLMGFGFRGPKAPTLGFDLAGTVEAVGSSVTRVQVGDEVFGSGEGTFAEYAAVPESQLAVRPAALPVEQAAATPHGGLTALQGLRDHGRLEAGQHVLVIGASGAVGSMAVQIAKVLGATVTGVCSTAKVDMVRGLGADEVVDYTQDDFAAAGQRYDLVFDTGGNSPLGRLRRVLTPEGTLVIVGGEGGSRWTGGLERQLAAVVLSRLSSQRMTTFVAAPRADDLDALAVMAGEHGLGPVVARTVPLAGAAEALAEVEAGRLAGRVVLLVR